MKKILCVLTIILLIILCGIYFLKQKEEHYVVVTGTGPVIVKRYLEDGYRVIGRYKLSNPHPRQLTGQDYKTIIDTLRGGWIEQHYPNSILQRHLNIDESFVERGIKYVFTMINEGPMEEGDFYLLEIPTIHEHKTLKVYIAKALTLEFDDEHHPTPFVTLFFYDEKWHKEYDDNTFYEPGDFY